MEYKSVMNWLEKHNSLVWFLVIIQASFIFFLSSIPYPEQPEAIRTEYTPIVEHIIEYAILGFLLVIGLRSKNYKRAFLIAFFISAIYGVTDEIHQIFVPGRHATLDDIFFDSVGSAIGALIGQFGRNS